MKKIIKLCIAIIILISLCSCSVYDKKDDAFLVDSKKMRTFVANERKQEDLP